MSEAYDWLRGPVMFYLSLIYLALLAALLVLWIDVPRVVESGVIESSLTESGELPDEGNAIERLPVLSAEEIAFENAAFAWGRWCGLVLVAIWPIFVIEQIYYRLQARSGASFRARHPYWWAFCLLPPLRLGAHRRESTEQVWLPKLGVQQVDRQLRKRLEKAFSFPMIWIAMLILPVLALQQIFKERIADYPALRLALHFGTGLIWFAFTVEFLVMVSVAHSKLDYCKKHWLDLAIILLPLISFLRTLRIMRAARLAKLGRLQQLSRVVRVYRLRGVAMRALRALMLLDVMHRLLRTKPEDRLRRLQFQYQEKQHELEELAEKITLLEQSIQAGRNEPKDEEDPLERLRNAALEER